MDRQELKEYSRRVGNLRKPCSMDCSVCFSSSLGRLRKNCRKDMAKDLVMAQRNLGIDLTSINVPN